MKICIKDINILCKGEQLKKMILEKYHSLNDFLEENKINLYTNSIVSYLNRKEIPSQKFKKVLEKVFGTNYEELFVSEEQQIEQYVYRIYDNLDLYIDKDSEEVIEYLRKICIQKSLWLSASRLYRILSIQNFNANNLPLAIELIKIAIDFAEYQKNNDLLINYTFDLLHLYFFIREYNNALDISRKIEKILFGLDNRDNYWFFLLYYYQGQIYTHINNYISALSMLNNALNYASNSFDISRILISIGSLYIFQSDYLLASEYFLKTTSLEQIDETEYLAISYICMAEIEKQSNNYNKSIENIKTALSFTKTDLSVFFAIPYIELLIIKKEFEVAIREIKINLNILTTANINGINKENVIFYTILIIQLCSKYNCYNIISLLKLHILPYLLQSTEESTNINDIELTLIGYLHSLNGNPQEDFHTIQSLAIYPFYYILLDYTDTYGINKYKPHIIYKYF